MIFQHIKVQNGNEGTLQCIPMQFHTLNRFSSQWKGTHVTDMSTHALLFVKHQGMPLSLTRWLHVIVLPEADTTAWRDFDHDCHGVLLPCSANLCTISESELCGSKIVTLVPLSPQHLCSSLVVTFAFIICTSINRRPLLLTCCRLWASAIFYVYFTDLLSLCDTYVHAWL